MITLQNNDVFVLIDEQGAELKSLVLQSTGREYMWSGDSAFWGKFSPVLFPIVGSLANDTYYLEGKEYHLPRHGFARDQLFTAEQPSRCEAIFTINSSADTLVNYPFEFTLSLHYRLYKNQLTCNYIISNQGDSDMYFSIGGHPAFAVPMDDEALYTDYYLQFHKPAKLVRHKLENGLIGNATEDLVLKAANSFSEETVDWVLGLKPSLFYEDAIVLKNTGTDYVLLGSDLHPQGLQFDFPGFPYLGIWAAKNAPFVCIEPWCGIADHVDHNQQLDQKEGINLLEPGREWQRSWAVRVF
jgi:galactose mutarotase-like enzyme